MGEYSMRTMATKVPPFSGLAATSIAALSATMIGQNASAQERSADMLLTTQYEDNLLRTSKAVQDTLPHQGSDIITFASVTGGISTKLEPVSLEAGGTFGRRFYAYNSHLDASEYAASAKAEYLAESGSANLDGIFTHQNSTFNDPLFRGSNIQDRLRATARVARAIYGRFHLTGTANYSTNSNSEANVSRGDNHSTGFGVGFQYVSSLKNSIAIGYAESRATGANRSVIVDGVPVFYTAGSRNKSVSVNIEWRPSVIWSAHGNFGYTRHDDRSLLNADFKGFVANGTISWAPTPLLKFRLIGRRAFSTLNEEFSNGVKETNFAVEADLKASERLNIAGTIGRANREYRYDLQANDPTTAGRTEKFNTYQLDLNYQTGSKFQINLFFSRAERRANLAGYTFNANTVGLKLTRALFKF